jgi:hypothetical protein
MVYVGRHHLLFLLLLLLLEFSYSVKMYNKCNVDNKENPLIYSGLSSETVHKGELLIIQPAAHTIVG